jgi:hypothetical protein
LKFCENFGVETKSKSQKTHSSTQSQSPENDKREKKSCKVWKKKIVCLSETKKPKKKRILCVLGKERKKISFFEVNSFFDFSFHTFDILKSPSLFFFKKERKVKIKYQLWKRKKINSKKIYSLFFQQSIRMILVSLTHTLKIFPTFLFF